MTPRNKHKNMLHIRSAATLLLVATNASVQSEQNVSYQHDLMGNLI